MERSDLERFGTENKSTLAYNEIKQLLNTIKVVKARFVFQKIKQLLDTIPLEAAAALEITSCLNGTALLLKELCKQQYFLNEVHGQVVLDLSKHKKSFSDENSSKLMLLHKRKILDFAYEINEQIQAKHNLVAHLIEVNKKWCSFEKEFNEKLNVHMMMSKDIFDSTHFQLQQKKQTKKLKKIRQIKKVAEIAWAVMSVHIIDFRKDNKFSQILLRINQAKQLSLENSR